VWVLGQRGGTVSRVDPATNAVAATIALGGPVDTGDIAVGGGGVWVRGGGALVTRIDPATDAVTDRYGPPQDGGGVAAGDSAIWITAKGDAMIWCLPVR
jgi:streptogramin lyase